MINGYWTEEMWIDGARFWHIDEYRGFKVRPTTNPLPSDVRFREDLVFFKNGDEETAAVRVLNSYKYRHGKKSLRKNKDMMRR